MADIAGKYIREKIGSHYIKLKADGSYFLYDGSAGFAGTYKATGSEITVSVGESTSRGKIQRGVIIDDEGERWVRTDDPLVSMTWLPAVIRRDDFPWELIEAAGGLVLLITLLISVRRP